MRHAHPPATSQPATQHTQPTSATLTPTSALSATSTDPATHLPPTLATLDAIYNHTLRVSVQTRELAAESFDYSAPTDIWTRILRQRAEAGVVNRIRGLATALRRLARGRQRSQAVARLATQFVERLRELAEFVPEYEPWESAPSPQFEYEYGYEEPTHVRYFPSDESGERLNEIRASLRGLIRQLWELFEHDHDPIAGFLATARAAVGQVLAGGGEGGGEGEREREGAEVVLGWLDAMSEVETCSIGGSG